MPYKDPEKRRTYQREYKRRQRGNCQTLSNPRLTPSKTVKRKVYICQKLPSYRLNGLIQFKNGLFVTDQPEEQKRIESDLLYGEEIFSWSVDP